MVNGVKVSILCSLALDKLPGRKKPRIKLIWKKTVLSHITFYLEDDDHKPVDFVKERICFACQLIRI